MDKPNKILEKGFYYHYKHDTAGEVNNYAYEAIGIGLHTEERNYTVIYRPLYKNTFLDQADYCVRPYDIFMGDVEKDGFFVPRFRKIEDVSVVKKLQAIKTEMYPN